MGDVAIVMAAIGDVAISMPPAALKSTSLAGPRRLAGRALHRRDP
jgi:hypothetical protein